MFPKFVMKMKIGPLNMFKKRDACIAAKILAVGLYSVQIIFAFFFMLHCIIIRF
jgi:hypothetical protein